MPGYIVKSGHYQLEELGLVHITVKSNCRKVVARWRDAALRVTAPLNIPYDELMSILRRMAPRIEKARPASVYHPGLELDFGELKVSITTQDIKPDRMIANIDNGHGSIAVGSAWSFDEPDTVKTINRFMCRMAQSIAPQVLIPRAREVARQVGRTPALWTISHGHRVLGHCNSRGEIALSYALIFFPTHLRDYVICHELAHLSEMNHSPRFHAICDSYCGGREKALIAQLKAYRCPVLS